MITELVNVGLLGVCVGVVANTMARTKVFKTFRLAVYRRSRWFGDLFRCPYCLSHWLAFVAVAAFGSQYRITNNFLDYIVVSFALVFIASCTVGLILTVFSGVAPVDQAEVDAILEEQHPIHPLSAEEVEQQVD